MRVLLLGTPGSRRSVLASVVAEAFRIPPISAGGILRDAVKTGAALGQEAKAAMDAGELVSDTLIITALKDRIGQPDCARGFLLDSFPSALPQAEALVSAGIELDHVLNICVDDEEIVQRVVGRRGNPPKAEGQDDVTGEAVVQLIDDTEEAVRRRLSIYREQTKPLVDFYLRLGSDKGKPVYSYIEDVGSIADIASKVIAALS